MEGVHHGNRQTANILRPALVHLSHRRFRNALALEPLADLPVGDDGLGLVLLVGIHGVDDVVEVSVRDQDPVEALDGLESLRAGGIVHAAGGAAGDP